VTAKDVLSSSPVQLVVAWATDDYVVARSPIDAVVAALTSKPEVVSRASTDKVIATTRPDPIGAPERHDYVWPGCSIDVERYGVVVGSTVDRRYLPEAGHSSQCTGWNERGHRRSQDEDRNNGHEAAHS
jgi:hypothetical protein